MSSQKKIDNIVLESIYDEQLDSSVLGGYSVRRLTTYGIVVGLFFPLFAWAFDFLIDNYEFSFNCQCKKEKLFKCRN